MMRKTLAIIPLLLLTGLLAEAREHLLDYAVVLEEPAVTQKTSSRQALASAEARGHLARIRTAQTVLRAQLTQRGVRVIGASQLLVNAVFVRATRQQAKEIRALAGVSRVLYAPPIHKNLNAALPLANVPAAWSAVGGMEGAGRGVKIGIIDSGIDQTHPAFQDSSLTVDNGFPKGDTKYTNNKVIVARSYEPLFPFPDDSTPRDRSGHGTAIAMIAAGVSNRGPVTDITGVAPKAQLGNYKIFGSPGVNDTTRANVLVAALEDALADGMDIVTLSIGDPAVYGPLDEDDQSCSGVCDVRAQAVEAAVRSGMTVVVSAGNDGDTPGTVNTPGTAPSAITVGASTNSHLFYSFVWAPGQNIDALYGDGPKTRVMAVVRDAGLACSPVGAGSLSGAIAVVRRGDCLFADKVLNAQNAGAVGVVIYHDTSNFPFAPLGLTATSIPTVMVGSEGGTVLRNVAQQNANAQVILDPALHAVDDTPNLVASFSSRGPSIRDALIKPELVAPGTDIYTATQNLDPNSDLWSADRYTSVSRSTSFAVPFVAGTAALVKQRHPDFSPAKIKSALVNTASTEVNDGSGQARVGSAGAGKLDAQAAVSAGATCEPSTIDFGVLGTGSLPSVELTVTNTGTAAATFNIAVAPRDSDNNARVTVSPASLQLTPGQSGKVTVALQGSRPAAGSYEGAVTISGGNTNLRVPYLYLVGDGRPAHIFPVINSFFTGVVNDQEWLIAFRLLDRYGVAVTDQAAQFRVVSGGGTIVEADGTTDPLGIAAASVNLGSTAGDQIFTAAAGGLTVEFDGFARLMPTIGANGVVNAASSETGQGLAPGSYATIYGTNLSDAAKAATTAALPVSLAGISVSFDGGGLSLPGHLHYVSPGQMNVQIPWEFAGQSSVQMKVNVGDIPTALYTLTLNQYSPAPFETDAGGQRVATVLDQQFRLVTPANPAQKGGVIHIYCNGLGPTDPQPASGEPSPAAEPFARTRVTPGVTIGGRPAQVAFSGLAPNFVGLYQIDVTVPSDVPTGLQPLVLSIGGVNSKPANLPVQ